VQAGRARWHIEHEHHNTLNTTGDPLEHHDGPGQPHLSAVLLTRHLFAWLFHTGRGGVDQPYHLVRQALAARPTFVQDLQALPRSLLLESWDQRRDFMLQGLEIASPPDASENFKMRTAGNPSCSSTRIAARLFSRTLSTTVELFMSHRWLVTALVTRLARPRPRRSQRV
jgi:hypothetical protein